MECKSGRVQRASEARERAERFPSGEVLPEEAFDDGEKEIEFARQIAAGVFQLTGVRQSLAPLGFTGIER